jgi:hypothetical protein
VDKASILTETIAYLKELQRRVQELESSRELTTPSETTTRTTRPRGISNESARKKLCAGSKRESPALEVDGDVVNKEHPWVLPKDGTSNVTVTVANTDVLLEVQCRWEELLMTRVFDAIKSLHLDVLSVQASTPDGFMGLKIRAQVNITLAIALHTALVSSHVSHPLTSCWLESLVYVLMQLFLFNLYAVCRLRCRGALDDQRGSS